MEDKTKTREGQAAPQQRNLLILQMLIEPRDCQAPGQALGTQRLLTPCSQGDRQHPGVLVR